MLTMGPACPDNNSNNNNSNASSVIDMSGGNGANGSGGSADELYIESYGTGGAQFGIQKGVPDGFSLPAEPKPEFGDDPVVVSRNTVVDVYVNQAAADADVTLEDGDLYLLLNDTNLYVRDSVGGDFAASGLKVNQGVKLTLGLNTNSWGNSGQDGAYIYTNYDIDIAGVVTVKTLDTGNVNGQTIETGMTDRDMGWLELYSGLNLFLAQSGKLLTNGANATVTGDRGGVGGAVWPYAYSGVFLHGLIDASGGNGLDAGDGGDGAYYDGDPDEIYPWTDEGLIVNTGTLDASGGDGADGGDAGEVYFYAETFIYNTGRLMSNGGKGLDGDGGDGDEIYLEAEYAGAFNRGKLESNGGDGLDGDGGDAGYLYIYSANATYMGQLITSGPLEFFGGDGANGDGGDGGYMYLENYGGDMIVKGPINADGGLGENGDGGEGGDLYLYQYGGVDEGYGEDINPGDIIVAGNIRIAGGDGSVSGGGGGYIYAYNTDYVDDDAGLPNFGVYFVGYDTVKAWGGDGGNGNGGTGGYVDFDAYNAWYGDDDTESPVGPVIFKSRFDAFGGDAANGTGGNGGYVDLNNEDEFYIGKSDAILDGSCNLHGGDGELGGGDGGYLDIYGYDQTQVSGTMNLDGGDALLGNNNGGDGGYTDISSTNDVVLSGSISANGGDASGTGTGGAPSLSNILIYAGGQTRSSMAISAIGGDSPGGPGGDGGQIDLFSETDHTTFNRNMRVTGGDGVTDGDEGQIWIDWTIWNGVP
jgi:hypothetical protein